MSERSDDLYMSDPDAKTLRGFIRGLEICAKYMPDGINAKWALGAEHDVIWVYASTTDLLEDSEDGRSLTSLGFHVDGGCWAFYT